MSPHRLSCTRWWGFGDAPDRDLAPRRCVVADIADEKTGLIAAWAQPQCFPIGGIDAKVFRHEEDLPKTPAAAKHAMKQWRACGFWRSQDGHKFVSFMFGCAAHLGRPVYVLERADGGGVLDGAVEGPRRAATGWAREGRAVTRPGEARRGESASAVGEWMDDDACLAAALVPPSGWFECIERLIDRRRSTRRLPRREGWPRCRANREARTIARSGAGRRAR